MIGYAENDDEVQVFDTELETVWRFKSEGSGAAAKNGAIDPAGQYFAFTSCDGFLSIFQLPNG